MQARVSAIDAFREWREDEEAKLEDLIELVLEDNPTELMLAGTAGHKALQFAQPGEHAVLQADGFTFLMPEDAELVLPPVREIRAFKNYGGLRVTGQVDVLDSRRLDDHKFTTYYDAERFLRKFQWRFYLDLFEADCFRWNIFDMYEVGPRTYQVKAIHTLEQYRYPELHADCARLAADFHEFASKHLPDLHQLPDCRPLAEAA